MHKNAFLHRNLTSCVTATSLLLLFAFSFHNFLTIGMLLHQPESRAPFLSQRSNVEQVPQRNNNQDLFCICIYSIGKACLGMLFTIHLCLRWADFSSWYLLIQWRYRKMQTEVQAGVLREWGTEVQILHSLMPGFKSVVTSWSNSLSTSTFALGQNSVLKNLKYSKEALFFLNARMK